MNIKGLGTTADSDGNFIIASVPVGRHTLKVTLISYAPQPNGEIIRKENQLSFLPVLFYRIDF